MLLYLYDNLYITFEIKYSNHEHIYSIALTVIYHFVHPSADVFRMSYSFIVLYLDTSPRRL